MAKEVVQSISEYFINDGIEGVELTKDILYYLYYTTNDDKLRKIIIEWYNKENFCIKCRHIINENYNCKYCDKN